MVMLDRWVKILDYLREKKSAEVQEIMDEFNISRSTVRRDLIEMEKQKLIIRTRGGAEIIENAVDFGDNLIEKVFSANVEAKRKIAKKAAQFINDNDFIFIDSGSTCYYLIDYITAKNVTVVTNGIMHIQKLMERGIGTYILGGYAKPDANLIEGEDTEEKLRLMNFDVSFLGTLGIDSIGGFKTNSMSDVTIKKTVLKSSEKCYILADTSKFNVRRLYTYAKLDEALVITDSKPNFDDERLKVIYAE